MYPRGLIKQKMQNTTVAIKNILKTPLKYPTLTPNNLSATIIDAKVLLIDDAKSGISGIALFKSSLAIVLLICLAIQYSDIK